MDWGKCTEKELLEMEKIVGAGGWGDRVPERKLEPGDRGEAVVAPPVIAVGCGHLFAGYINFFYHYISPG